MSTEILDRIWNIYVERENEIMRWKRFCIDYLEKGYNVEDLKQHLRKNMSKYEIYPDSIHFAEGLLFFIAWHEGKKVLIVYGDGNSHERFDSNVTLVNGVKVQICELNVENCKLIRNLFPFTKPSNHKRKGITIGLGDRLGLASAGHIRAIKGLPVFPILAQQSMRELNLTGRDYNDVLTSASWAIFQEGYMNGFGADGDHLKTFDEVKNAIDSGFTMITLDCSEYINNNVVLMSDTEIEKRCLEFPQKEIKLMEKTYLGQEFLLKRGMRITFESKTFRRIIIMYYDAIKFVTRVFNDIIVKCGRELDYEVSIDETITATSPEAHYFVASELIRNKVKVSSLAPRFCGEFQKGIDYKGDISQFSSEFETHSIIAEHFGYKISVHSGSDKFSIFPIIGEKSEGVYHIKTSGTSWLEAVRVIALKNPSLYRKIHEFAINHYLEAKKFYHVSAEINKVPDIDMLKDSELPALMNMEDARQVLHITYGYILQAKNSEGCFVFNDEIFKTLNLYESDYYFALKRHIGKHLAKLGINQTHF